MWNAALTRKEIIELVLGIRKADELELYQVSGVIPGEDRNLYYAYWQQIPTSISPLPNLLVAPEESIAELITALNALPQAPTPVTAFCRILTKEEAINLYQNVPHDTKQDMSVAILALSMAEAVLLSGGKLNLRQVTPAMCKRTLSYAWGKALIAQLPIKTIQQLPKRWVDTFTAVNSSALQDQISFVTADLLGPLGVCAHLAMGLEPPGYIGSLAYAIYHKNREQQDHIWKNLSNMLGDTLSLQDVASSTREERGGYLQKALKNALHRGIGSNEELVGACAFLATQVAPGSLEHLELLILGGNPAIALWYALFAALQAPSDVLMGVAGAGYRVLRELEAITDPLARPTADIAFSELRILERIGIESVTRKLGHFGELEVELVPCVTTSFTLHSRLRFRGEQENLPIEFEQPALRQMSPKARLHQIITMMSELEREIPEYESMNAQATKKQGATNKRSR